MQNYDGIGQHPQPVTDASVVDATPPPTASDAAYVPGFQLRGEIAGKPESFTAHGVSVNDLGAYPGGARASQIDPDLFGADLVTLARARDGYGLRAAGTPEPMMGAPRQGAILDQIEKYGVIRLGIGPAIPVVLLFAIAAVAIWTTRGRGKA